MSQVYSATSLYGTTPQAPSYGIAAPTQQMGTDDIAAGVRGLLDIRHNPLTWFGIVLLVTAGAIGVSGSVRLGRAKLGATLDKG